MAVHMSIRRWRQLLPVLCLLLVCIVLLYHQTLLQTWSARLSRRPVQILPQFGGFHYLLNSAAVVCTGAQPMHAVIVVHSDPRHPEVRQTIRDSLPADELAALGLRRAFMLGDASTGLSDTEPTIPQAVIAEESAHYGDLVQGSFHDSYHNLTLKHMMALDWAVTFCPQARHIVKMDDDIAYNVYELLDVLHGSAHAQYLGGNIFRKPKPYRGHDSKWRVSLEQWPREFFPSYVSGWLYIVSPDVANALVVTSASVPFFWIDDLYVTGILAEQLALNITTFNHRFGRFSDCGYYIVRQELPEPGHANRTVFAPSVMVIPTDHDLGLLKAFHRLCRYCRISPCLQRDRGEHCKNNY